MPAGFFQKRCLRSVSSRLYCVETIPENQVALVLGAPPEPHGSLSAIAHARLELALALFRARKVHALLISGNAFHPKGDETHVMKNHLTQHGVPESRLMIDGGASRTWESMLRARQMWKLKHLTIVTNMFHLPRSLLLADRACLQAIGATSADPFPARPSSLLKRAVREEASCVRMYCEGIFHK